MPVPRERFTQTYELTKDRPPPMRWRDYATLVRREWTKLLASDPGEKAIQKFLEQHPSMVPGPLSALGRLSSGHGPFPDALVTQPPLKALGGRTPDFVWLSRDSSFFNPVFIEIEDPAKPWLTRKGVPRAELTEALNQLRRWREWFDVPANRLTFLDHFEVPLVFRERKFQPIFVLIYGRRDSRSRELSNLRADLSKQDQFVVPYDHLKPDPEASQFLCVKNTTGRYRAVSFPPTVELGPASAEYLRLISGREAVIRANPLISVERKTFLIERLPYWDRYAEDGGGIFKPGHRE